MKFLLLPLIIGITSIVSAQDLTKKHANQILEKSIIYLKTSDSVSFIALWKIDDTPRPYHQKPFTEQDALNYFHYLKEFLDTALTHNFNINNIEVRRTSKREQSMKFGKYNIRAWFKYDQNYYKGFGYYLDFSENKWVIRFAPDTSILIKPKSKGVRNRS
jgi:hypothetical protein